LARSFANTIWPRFSPYFASVSGESGDVLRTQPETQQIHEALKTLTAGLPVLKVKIYNLDGLTLFSSEKSQIGENKSSNPGFFTAARQGQLASKLASRESFSSFEGPVQDRDLVECSLPIRLGNGPIEGVFELYDVTPLMGKIKRITNNMILGLALIFGLLYSVLFLIVRRADRTIKRQYIDLMTSEENIKVKNTALEHEIAEHKLTEDDLRKLSRAVEQSPATTIVTNLDGKIEYVNPRFTEVTGYALHEVVGKSSRVLKSGKTAASVYEGLWNTIVTGEEWRGELLNRKKDGDLYWAATSISAIKNQDGIITHFLGVSEDVTERKEAQEKLESAKLEAERANLAKSKFFASASHDLRQPIHTMSLYLSLLSSKATAAEHREIIDALQSSCESIEGLLNALLDISKLDAGVISPEVRPIHAGQLLQKIKIEFALQARRKRIDLHVVPVDAMVATDPTLFERILRNILSNAIRHTEQGRVLLGARRRGSTLRFEVWDTGAGIAGDEIEKIFQEFYQVGNPERDRNQGLGLGLAIVDRVAKLLGHALDVRSTLGRGSMFAIEVPIASDESRLVRELSGADQDSDEIVDTTVVLIEDNAAVLNGTKMILEDWGCRVIAAETIGAALEGIARSNHRPDVILADFRLRGNETGLMAIDSVNQFAGTTLPAIIITGDTDPKRIREALESGHTLLHKPVQAAKLKTALEAALRTARQFEAREQV
jgi:PAS domain S-box-containing protein